MPAIERLTEIFSKFPGIGPRQAKRFVYFLLNRDHKFIEDLAKNILSLKKNISTCNSCCRFYESNGKDVCDICEDSKREDGFLMILEKDADLENIERTGAYMGKYFVLGGSVPILDKDPGSKVKSKELLNVIKKGLETGTLKEVILATSVNPEGENTNSYLLKILNPFKEKYQLKISLLGRGLSTGTELEYSDKDTIENALRNRA